MSSRRLVSLSTLVALCGAPAALAAPFSFSTGAFNDQMATATRPDTAAKFEIESADDFILSSPTRINTVSFTGLLTGDTAPADIRTINLEMYRVFPLDSDPTRTPNVPTRINSPSDVAFAERTDVAFGAFALDPSFTASNSVQPGGIHAAPNQTTGGDGPVTGTLVRIDLVLASPFDLPADHYFFVPQVDVDGGEFLWLSAERPIASGTPFSPDLQAWARDANLDPDWLRIGTDIVGGATTFNLAFALSGETISAVAEPSELALLAALGMAAFGLRGKRREPS